MSARGNRDFASMKPVWQSDASARWLSLLPELVLSIVFASCMSILLSYSDVEDFGLLVVAMIATQVYVQVVLYACTYIARDARLVNLGWLIVIASMYLFSMPVSAFSGFDTPVGSLALMVSIAMMVGIFLFYFTRPRWGFVVLAVEMVTIIATSNYEPERLLVCLVGFGSMLALYVMRGSAVRITRPFFDEGRHMAGGGDADARPSPLRGVDGQVVAFAVAIGALCMAVALVGIPLFGVSVPEGSAPASTSGATQATEATDASGAAAVTDATSAVGATGAADATNAPDSAGAAGAVGAGNASESAMLAGASDASESTDAVGASDASESGDAAVSTNASNSAAAAGASDAPESTGASGASESAGSVSAAGSAQRGHPSEASGDGASSTAAEGDAATRKNSAETTDTAGGGEEREELQGAIPIGLLVFLLLPVAVVLSFCARLFKRRSVRRSIEREPREIDRVARVYLAIISRLEASGIERGKAETPREFLAIHGTELERLTAPVGFGLDEWTALTDFYENARYANLGPTDSELEMAWKLYDALPVCMRRAVGLPHYLAGPFWQM